MEYHITWNRQETLDYLKTLWWHRLYDADGTNYHSCFYETIDNDYWTQSEKVSVVNRWQEITLEKFKQLNNKTMTKFKLGDRVRIKPKLGRPTGEPWWTPQMDKFQLDEFTVDGFDSAWNIKHGIYYWYPDWLELVDEFKEWEVVLARDNDDEDDWEERIYLCTIPWNVNCKYVCVCSNDEEKYKNWEEFDTINWDQIKKLETKPEEITIEQLEKELGRKIKIIK